MRQTSIVKFLAIVGVTFSHALTDINIEYKNYLEKFKDSIWADKYSQESFIENVKNIELHNSQTEKYHKLGINHFTGISHNDLLMAYKTSAYICPTLGDLFQSNTPVGENSWDWRTIGI